MLGRDRQIRLRDERRVHGPGGVLEGDDDPVAIELGGDVDPARRALVAVHDHVGGRLVDGLHEVVHAHDRGVGRVRHVADERPDLGQPIEIGRDAQVPARPQGHASRA